MSSTHCNRQWKQAHSNPIENDKQWRKRITCKHYMSGGCNRGKKCWFNHALASNVSIYAAIINGICTLDTRSKAQQQRENIILNKLDDIAKATSAIQTQQNHQFLSLKTEIDIIKRDQQKMDKLLTKQMQSANKENRSLERMKHMLTSMERKHAKCNKALEEHMMRQTVHNQSIRQAVMELSHKTNAITPNQCMDTTKSLDLNSKRMINAGDSNGITTDGNHKYANDTSDNKAIHSPNINESCTFDTSSFGAAKGSNIDGGSLQLQKFNFDTSPFGSNDNTNGIDAYRGEVEDIKCGKQINLAQRECDVATNGTVDIAKVQTPNDPPNNELKAQELTSISPTTTPTATSKANKVEHTTRAQQLKVEGNELFKKKQYQNALEAYRAAQQLDPNEPTLVSNESAALYCMEEWDQFISCFDRLLDMKPNKALADKGKKRMNVIYRKRRNTIYRNYDGSDGLYPKEMKYHQQVVNKYKLQYSKATCF